MYPRIGGRRDRASSRRPPPVAGLSPLALVHDSGLAGDSNRTAVETLCLTRWGSPNSGLYTSASLCCPKFRDHVNFDARAEWHLRHADCTAGMDAPLPEHLNK